jgi:hypothetical protein
MIICVFRHFLETVEDPDIAALLRKTLEYPVSHVPQLVRFLQGDQWPVPQGFTDSDVNLQAPRLYSDSFMLYYLHYIGASVMDFYGKALVLCAREDVRNYFKACLGQSIELNDMTTRLLLEKGLYVRSPYLAPSQSVDFVTDRKFLGGWFGENRPLISMEITNYYSNLQRNALGKMLLIGFGQVASQPEIRKFMMRGTEIAGHHVEIFSSRLKQDDLAVSIPWDMTVSNSTVAPFSDKLMMFHTTSLIGMSIGYYGLGVGMSMRKDVAADFLRVIAETLKFASDGAKIMIDRGWLEEPPQAADRKELSGVTE